MTNSVYPYQTPPMSDLASGCLSLCLNSSMIFGNYCSTRLQADDILDAIFWALEGLRFYNNQIYGQSHLNSVHNTFMSY